jgi:fumarate reductase flavoprotein subunit
MSDSASQPFDVEADVVVVGAGACGLMATAIVAAAAPGAQVVLLEKCSRWGCNAEIAGGTIQAASTRLQRAAGIEDSPEIMAGDILRKSRNKSDPAVTLALCRKSADLVHWFIDDLGVPLELATEIRRIGHTRPRMHAHPQRSGAPLVGALRRRVESLDNVSYADDTPGRGLMTDGQGGVVGVVAGPDGQVQRIGCRRTVLATDGFGANREMIARYIPRMQDVLYVGAPGNTGDGIRWGMEIGAAVEHLAGYQGLGYVVPNHGTRINPGVVISGGIMVDRLARRFEREDQGYSEWSDVVLRQPGGIAVAIWDERIQREYAHAHTMTESLAAGAIKRAADVAQLAAAFKLDAATLDATIATYNRGVEARDDVLGRTLLELPLTPPYYAANVTGSLAHTLGGLKIDAHGRVLRANGAPIPNLYAGGGTAVGLSGDTPDGYLSASGLLTAYGLGMIIGEQVAASLSG